MSGFLRKASVYLWVRLLENRRFMNKWLILSNLKRADVNFVVLLCRWCLPLNVLFSSFCSSSYWYGSLLLWNDFSSRFLHSLHTLGVLRAVVALRWWHCHSLCLFLEALVVLESRCHDTCLDVCVCVFTIGLMCWGTIWSRRIFRKPEENCCSAKTWGQGNNDRQIQGRFLFAVFKVGYRWNCISGKY